MKTTILNMLIIVLLAYSYIEYNKSSIRLEKLQQEQIELITEQAFLTGALCKAKGKNIDSTWVDFQTINFKYPK